ncbi:hypothetical protein Ahy_B04g069754 [Arachis hypogaea]|uniref:Uncharacterized protein n=1 Tax=Arachis hypogaea TaxID=3818 RepID=A0A444ZDG1_ARAHY|nr:hypothetical protein Ahy_B04g069754 [Arachis hypogaea]
MAEMQEYQAKSKSKFSLSHEDAMLNDVNELQSPPRVKTRGRPKNRLWRINHSVKLQPLSCTRYELSWRGYEAL